MKEPATIKLGLGITGSFCTFKKTAKAVESLIEQGFDITPIYSHHAASYDTRFQKTKDFQQEIEALTGKKGIYTIPDAEPIGPKSPFDAMLLAPCTGNTMAKLVNGITDTAVLMAAKAHLRNEKPLIISLATNDALGFNFKNLGVLYNAKNIFFVPFGQDDYHKKTNSLIAHTELIPETIHSALKGKQLQPVLISPFS